MKKENVINLLNELYTDAMEKNKWDIALMLTQVLNLVREIDVVEKKIQ